MVSILPPPEVIASWPKQNLVNPENRGPALYNLSIALAVVGFIIICARLYSRTFITRALGIDDVLITYAFASGAAMSALVCIGNKTYHSGYHVWDVRLTMAKEHRLNVWISQWLYLTSTGAIKISVLLFYRRLSVSFSRAFYWATWVGIIYNIIQLVAFGLALLFVCLPVQAYWMAFDLRWAAQNAGKFKCVNEGYGLTTSAVFSVVGDLYAALLPSLLVARLQLPIRQKYAVAGLFAVGYIVVGMGVGRAVLLHETTLLTYDYTWSLWEVWIWSLLELWVGIYAASAPALKPFFKMFLIDPISSVVATARTGSSTKIPTIGGAGQAKKRGPRSWNCMPSDDVKSPDSAVIPISDSKLARSVSSGGGCPRCEALEMGERPNCLVENAFRSGDAPDSDYKAHCWSPASTKQSDDQKVPVSRVQSLKIGTKRTMSDSSRVRKHISTQTALSTHPSQRQFRLSNRQRSSPTRTLDSIQVNATPHNRSRSSSIPASPPLATTSSKSYGHHSILADDPRRLSQVGLAIFSNDGRAIPSELRRANTAGSDNSSYRLMNSTSPSYGRRMPTTTRSYDGSWMAFDEEDEHSEIAEDVFMEVRKQVEREERARATMRRVAEGEIRELQVSRRSSRASSRVMI